MDAHTTGTADGRVAINPTGAVLRRRNGLMNGTRAPYRMGGYEGNLSVKYMIRGSGMWETRQGRYRVDPRHFLVLNEGRRYGFEIDGELPIETFCAFLEPRFFADLVRAGTDRPERLLDDPARDPPAGPSLREHLRAADTEIVPVLVRMHAALRRGDDDGSHLEDGFRALGARLATLAIGDRVAPAPLRALRASTREELFTRLHRARDHAHAHFAEDLTVPALAKAACLAPHHFHATFRQLFGTTPNRYVQELRLLHAADLLSRSEMPILDVVRACGFASLPSFSRLFARRFGAPPGRFRRRPDPASTSDHPHDIRRNGEDGEGRGG